jgi:uncharacterized membrane protein
MVMIYRALHTRADGKESLANCPMQSTKLATLTIVAPNASFPMKMKRLLSLYIITMAGIQAASLNLVALVTDQYVLIANPLRYHALSTQKVGWAVALSTLTIVCPFAGVTAHVWDETEGCNYAANLPDWHHFINYVLVIAFPLTVVLVLQVLTIRISRRHLRQIQASTAIEDGSDERMVKRHRRGVVTNALICGALLIDWTPITVAFFIKTADPSVVHFTWFQTFIDCAASLYKNYGVWLPLIYAARSPEFRHLCKKLKARC